MSTAAVQDPIDLVLQSLPVNDNFDAVDVTNTQRNELAALAAKVGASAAQDVSQVDKAALKNLVSVIGDRIANDVSRDAVMAHTLLLVVFHQKLRDDTNEAKDLAFLCHSEARYLAYMDAVAKAAAEDKSLLKNPPLPPLDVALFWHSHMLSPVRYADDMGRRYGPAMIGIEFPLMRLAKMLSNEKIEDQDVGRAFWAANMPADQPFDLTPADVDETKVTGVVVCPSCETKLALNMAEYAAFRLHKQAHACTSCTTSFTLENAAVRRFLTIVKRAPFSAVAGAQVHPKTYMFAGKHQDNAADLAKLFDKAVWAKRVAALPTLATWANVRAIVFLPVAVACKDDLVLPGSRGRFILVQRAFEDVTVGPWSMDMVRAVRRQRRFSAKIERAARAGAHVVYHLHTEALVQYPKFLAAMTTRPKTSLVPTMAIDLAWHTHQLSHAAYARDTGALIGRVANHDDSDDAAAEARMAEGSAALPALWMQLFAEDYRRPNVPCTAGADEKVLCGCEEICDLAMAKEKVPCWWCDNICDLAMAKTKALCGCEDICDLAMAKEKVPCWWCDNICDLAMAKKKALCGCEDVCDLAMME
ncbi:hypothetical protein GGF31_005388 [Allomyces arbusculus]|nr:hypothetical protein GGF31_005388 [Allomyces arbusculus]